MGVQSLAYSIQNAVNERSKREARALRGTIRDGMFHCGNKSYPLKQAVDCNTSNGRRVWAQLSPNGDAVVVGA